MLLFRDKISITCLWIYLEHTIFEHKIENNNRNYWSNSTTSTPFYTNDDKLLKILLSSFTDKNGVRH